MDSKVHKDESERNIVFLWEYRKLFPKALEAFTYQLIQLETRGSGYSKSESSSMIDLSDTLYDSDNLAGDNYD